MQVNHDQCVKTINHYRGLSYMTPKENSQYAYKTGMNKNIGENCNFSILTNCQVIKICEMLEKGMRYRDILLELGMDINNSNNFDLIGNIKRGIAWNSISCNYTFPNINYSFLAYSEEEVRLMCELIQQNKSYSEIYEKIFPGGKYISSYKNKQFYEFVRRLKKKEVFSFIADQYF